MWIEVKGERGFVLGCIYMPADSENASFIESSYLNPKRGCAQYEGEGQVVILIPQLEIIR